MAVAILNSDSTDYPRKDGQAELTSVGQSHIKVNLPNPGLNPDTETDSVLRYFPMPVYDASLRMTSGPVPIYLLYTS